MEAMEAMEGKIFAVSAPCTLHDGPRRSIVVRTDSDRPPCSPFLAGFENVGGRKLCWVSVPAEMPIGV